MDCKLCGAIETQMIAHAVIAPWISRITGNMVQDNFSKLWVCSGCSFQFFEHRYSEAEMSALYSGYRGDEYFAFRHSYEPWFSRSDMNNWNPSKNAAAVESRRSYMSGFFNQNGVDLHTINDVLDFGGDLGQFFPEETGGKRYLIDPANPVTSNDEIVRVQSIESLWESCGLIMNCHTLEHIPSLESTLASLVPVLRKDAYLYIEVPMDIFKVGKFHSSPNYKKFLKFLVKKKKLFVIFDFLTGVYRMYFHRIPFWGIVKQSEHINYFNKESLPELLSNTHLKLVSISEPDLNFGQGRIKLGRISLLARKT